MLIARGYQNELVYLGDNVYFRHGSSCIQANPRKSVDLNKKIQSQQNGHLWLKSLRKYHNFSNK